MDKNVKKEFSNIYDQYIGNIYRFVFFKVSAEDIAEDITSETFLRGLKTYLQKKGEIKNVRAFLYRIANNLVIDFYRTRGQAIIVSVDDYKELADLRNDLRKKAVFDSDMEMIRTALSSMRDDYQNIIILRYLDDMSISEIAHILEKENGAVRTMLHRAMKELNAEISKKESL